MKVTDVGAIALMFKPFETVVPDATPLIVAVVSADTPVVETLNVADVCPAATVTEAGTVALAESDDRLTISPPVGAGEDNVTLPALADPPTTEAGVNPLDTGSTGLIVRDDSDD